MIKTNLSNIIEYYEITYKDENGTVFSPLLTVQNDIVTKTNIYIEPEKQKTGIPREWSAYSPETLIDRYGTPSKVVFFVDRGAPTASYGMTMKFDVVGLIVAYLGHELGPNLQICPLTDQMDDLQIWMGKDPQNPLLDGVLLEDATSMTMKEFTKLMSENPDKACFNVKGKMFP